MIDPRDEFIGRVVKGKSFADLGGIWGTVNEKVSVAHQHGARALTMIDQIPFEQDDWRSFNERLNQLNIPHTECVSKDILALADQPDSPKYDVVHCSGVLYHIPDPMRLMDTLRKITGEYLVVGSVITPTVLKTKEGTLQIPEGTCLFIPALEKAEQAIAKSYWQEFVQDGAVGLTKELESWRDTHYVPWWWLPTVTAFKAMGRAAGFEFVDGAYFWNNNAYVQLLKAKI